MAFQLAFSENHVPSTKAPDPYMHVFLDVAKGNVLAFFELLTQPAMGCDRIRRNECSTSPKVRRGGTAGVQAALEKNGVDMLGVTDHGSFHSIYFFDPNGQRLEIACPDPREEELNKRLDSVKWDMLKSGR